jgi:hypothetical protein
MAHLGRKLALGKVQNHRMDEFHPLAVGIGLGEAIAACASEQTSAPSLFIKANADGH